MRSPPGDRHGWNRLDHYLSIHESILAEFREFLIERDDLETKLVNATTLIIRGRIWCTGSVFRDVNKVLALNDRDQVRTVRYSYQACLHSNPPRRIFRYDNAHRYIREQHADAHHKHIFDPVTGDELPSSPEWIGHDRWPTLADILDELYEWHHEVGQHLNGQR